MNLVTLFGNTTRDGELSHLPTGSAVLKFGLATNKKWKDQQGNMQEKVEFHNIVMFGKRAESLAQYIKKGSKLLVQGEINYSKSEKDGVARYFTSINANNVEFGGGSQSQTQSSSNSVLDEAQETFKGSKVDSDFVDADTIPF